MSEEKKFVSAYVDKTTQELAENNPYVAEASKKVLKFAENLNDALIQNGVGLTAENRNGENYTVKAAVSVGQATKWNKETKSAENLVHKDGSPVYAVKVDFKAGNETLSMMFKEDVSKGVKPVSLNAVKWTTNQETNKRQPNYIKNDDIERSDILSDQLKKAAQFVNNHIEFEVKSYKTPEYNKNVSELEKLAINLNKNFTETTVNKDGKNVKESYAKYISNEENNGYGEKVQLRNHKNNIVVELGNNKEGKPFAKAINYDLPKADGKGFESVFINNSDDLKKFAPNREIADAVKDFKDIDAQKEITKPKNKQAYYER